MPITFTYDSSSSKITLTPTLYKDVTVYLGDGSQTVPEGVALYVLDKRDNRVGPFRTNAFGVAHVASALVNGTESDFRLLVEDARYQRYEGAYGSQVRLATRSVCGLSVAVLSGTEPAESDFTARLSWATGSLLQGASGGQTAFSFDCADGPEKGANVALECTDRAGLYRGATQKYVFAGAEDQAVNFSVSPVPRVGVLVEDETGIPIAGARVELVSGGAVIGTAETDAGGATRFLDTETPGMAGEMTVRCAAKGYAEGAGTVQSGNDVTVALKRASARELAVYVNQTVAGLVVRATSGVESVAAETDAGGTAALSGYFTGELEVTVEDPAGRYEAATVRQTTFTTPIRVSLAEVIELTVRCSSRSAGAAGLEVSLSLGERGLGERETNADGTAVFQLGGKVVPGQVVAVRVRDPAGRFRAAERNVSYADLKTPLEVELERQQGFRFRVDTTEAGGPAEGLCRNVRVELWDGANASVFRKCTDACVTEFALGEEAGVLALGGRATLEVEAAGARLFQQTLSLAEDNAVAVALESSRMPGWGVAVLCFCVAALAAGVVAGVAGLTLQRRRLQQVVMRPERTTPVGASRVTFDSPPGKQRFAI